MIRFMTEASMRECEAGDMPDRDEDEPRSEPVEESPQSESGVAFGVGRVRVVTELEHGRILTGRLQVEQLVEP